MNDPSPFSGDVVRRRSDQCGWKSVQSENSLSPDESSWHLSSNTEVDFMYSRESKSLYVYIHSAVSDILWVMTPFSPAFANLPMFISVYGVRNDRSRARRRVHVRWLTGDWHMLICILDGCMIHTVCHCFDKLHDVYPTCHSTPLMIDLLLYFPCLNAFSLDDTFTYEAFNNWQRFIFVHLSTRSQYRTVTKVLIKQSHIRMFDCLIDNLIIPY